MGFLNYGNVGNLRHILPIRWSEGVLVRRLLSAPPFEPQTEGLHHNYVGFWGRAVYLKYSQISARQVGTHTRTLIHTNKALSDSARGGLATAGRSGDHAAASTCCKCESHSSNVPPALNAAAAAKAKWDCLISGEHNARFVVASVVACVLVGMETRQHENDVNESVLSQWDSFFLVHH